MKPIESKKSLWLSSATAAVLVIAGGAGYRVLAAHYARPIDSVRIPPGTLGGLPIIVGDWVGRDVPMNKRVIIATDTDDHLNRAYTLGSRATVALFIGYGVNLRDLAPHRPEVCYPGAGWTLDQTRSIEIGKQGESALDAQVHHFHRGALATERVTVLNYYLVDGKYCQDVTLLRSKAWRRGNDPTYVAQIQISCGNAVSEERAGQLVQRFAADSAPLIHSLLTEAVQDALASEGNNG